jgi:hypothetical protein
VTTDLLSPTIAAPDGTAVGADRSAFCWAKYGTEAGEVASSILDRKEAERQANGGLFLWGIGNSIRPSLEALVEIDEQPVVRFTAMKSAPAAIDVAPSHIAIWDSGVGMDGDEFPLPKWSVVTSRTGPGVSARSHFALVCRSEEPIAEMEIDPMFAGQLTNYVSGSRVGGSQVTSVVREDRTAAQHGARYARGFTAQLVFPYLVSLKVSSVVPSHQLPSRSAFSALLDMRRSLFG